MTAGIVAGYTRREALAKLGGDRRVRRARRVLRPPDADVQRGDAPSARILGRNQHGARDDPHRRGALRGGSSLSGEVLRAAAQLQARARPSSWRRTTRARCWTLCGRAVWLLRGRVQASGDPEEVYEAYHEGMRLESERRSAVDPISARHQHDHLEIDENRFGTLEIEIADVAVVRAEEHREGSQDAAVGLRVDLEPHHPIDDPIVGVSLHRVADGAVVLNVSSDDDGFRLGRVEETTPVTFGWTGSMSSRARTGSPSASTNPVELRLRLPLAGLLPRGRRQRHGVRPAPLLAREPHRLLLA